MPLNFMNLYYISQHVNNGYDTYSAAVVAAETPKAARMIHPGGYLDWNGTEIEYDGSWPAAADVNVKLIGKAILGAKAGIVLSSFHAG